jgi:transcriptional regulator with XRE-family HTH domain
MKQSEGDILAKFGSRLKQLRLQKGWSQEKLAARSELHRTYIGAIERGEQNISLKNIEKLALALELPLTSLLIFEERDLRKPDELDG